MLGLGLSVNNGGFSGGGGGVSYDADASAYFARMSTQPDATQKGYISTLIAGIKEDNSLTNLSDGFDLFYILASHDPTEALLNVAKASHDATAVNSPTFTASEGYAGNGTTSYLNTNYSASTQGVVYAQNDAIVGIYQRNNAASIKQQIGVSNAAASYSGIYTRYTGDTFYGYANANGSLGENSAANADSRGLFTTARTGANLQRSYKNGIAIGLNNAIASQALYSGNFYILCHNLAGVAASFCADQISIAFIGKASVIDQAALYTRIQAYMASLGTSV